MRTRTRLLLGVVGLLLAQPAGAQVSVDKVPTPTPAKPKPAPAKPKPAPLKPKPKRPKPAPVKPTTVVEPAPTPVKPKATVGEPTPTPVKPVPARQDLSSPSASTPARCPDDMVEVAGATFSMGTQTISDAYPQHRVTVDGFCIDRYEVTVRSYASCVASGTCTATSMSAINAQGAKPCMAAAGREDHPVSCVSWAQAVAFCASRDRRLPTEAEWELAARGTDGRAYPWGNDEPTASHTNGILDRFPDTAPVGSFPLDVSPYGAFDMAGNVGEWVADWAGSYGAAEVRNPTGPATGGLRINRGGYFGAPTTSPLTYVTWVRGAYSPEQQWAIIGMRCARKLGP